MYTELSEKFRQFQWLLRKNRMRGYAQGGHMADTSRGQGRILAILKLRDGISTRDLSYLLGVRVSSLNELLGKMEKNGYVVREAGEQDKRVMLVKLTEKGRSEDQPEDRGFGDIFSCLTEEEQSTLSVLLDKLIAALREKIGDDEELYARLGELRERFGDFRGTPPFGGAPFGPHFHGRGGCGFDRFDRES